MTTRKYVLTAIDESNGMTEQELNDLLVKAENGDITALNDLDIMVAKQLGYTIKEESHTLLAVLGHKFSVYNPEGELLGTGGTERDAWLFADLCWSADVHNASNLPMPKHLRLEFCRQYIGENIFSLADYIDDTVSVASCASKSLSLAMVVAWLRMRLSIKQQG